MKLFLTSSGLSNDNQEEFFRLLGKRPNGLRLAFVHTAAKGDHPMMPLPELESALKITEDYQGLVRFGFIIEFVDLSHLSPDIVVETFSKFDVVYVYGGNTFYLLHQARASGFLTHAAEILVDKVYVGVSAGSIIAGPDITLAGWPPNGDKNAVGIQDMMGMNFSPSAIMPHWNPTWPTPKEAEEYPHDIMYIKDGDAVVVA